jgi:hypothetical protein
MKKYSFSRIEDNTNEPIDTKEFESLYDAIVFFSTVKQLPPDAFLKIYKVFKHD